MVDIPEVLHGFTKIKVPGGGEGETDNEVVEYAVAAAVVIGALVFAGNAIYNWFKPDTQK